MIRPAPGTVKHEKKRIHPYNGGIKRYDITIIGGGIIGLATAMSLVRRLPGKQCALLEKEPRLAQHQTGRNSGVIHSGIYYRPGSLKARLCVAGAKALIDFCRALQIPHQLCGKLIVATAPDEIPRLRELLSRGQANGVAGLRLLDSDHLQEVEPNARGVLAVHLPEVGIVDYRRVAEQFSHCIQAGGGQIRTAERVFSIRHFQENLILETSAGAIETRFAVNCGGLLADRILRFSGMSTSIQIIPFRGEYYEAVPSKAHLVRGLLYPVPDPQFPFLGVHFTTKIDGRLEVGPNAVIALAREGYRKSDFRIGDLLEMARFPGFWRMGIRHWRYGFRELYRCLNKGAFVRSAQRLVPALQASDLLPSPSGVRAQAVERSGDFVDDFHLVKGARMIHVINAPSPAATASIPIGELVADAVEGQLGLS